MTNENLYLNWFELLKQPLSVGHTQWRFNPIWYWNQFNWAVGLKIHMHCLSTGPLANFEEIKNLKWNQMILYDAQKLDVPCMYNKSQKKQNKITSYILIYMFDCHSFFFSSIFRSFNHFVYFKQHNTSARSKLRSTLKSKPIFATV